MDQWIFSWICFGGIMINEKEIRNHTRRANKKRKTKIRNKNEKEGKRKKNNKIEINKIR